MKISHAMAAAALLLMTLPATIGLAAPDGASRALFPRPAELEPDVRFWRRVYTEVGTDGGFIHDSRDLRVVYEVIKFPSGANSRSRERYIEKAKRGYRDALRSLAQGRRSKLSRTERQVLALFPQGVSNTTLRAAAGNIRFQLGQADKFRAGLIRSGAWRQEILATLRELGLPEELVALPHVESSYTPHAYSRVGAAGLWQFTRSTGRRYMRVDHVVDERMDPFVATGAAARLLQHNKQSTGTWPLALTAYNHGAAGMRRASRQAGTTDIAVIARKYKSRTFGFASRNFYVEFLAALEVDRNAEHYFGVLPYVTPMDYDTATVPAYIPATALAKALGIDRDTLRDHNPSLRSLVWNGSKRVPKGHVLRVPRGRLEAPLSTLIASVPDPHRYARQTRDAHHKVRRGETLSTIATRYGVSISSLVDMNRLRSRHSIRAGQKLRLPPEAASAGKQHAAVARVSAPPAPSTPPKDGTYTVRRGDSISRIATRFGISERALMQWNDIRNRHRIHRGQELRVAPPETKLAAAPPRPKPAPEPPPAPVAPPEREPEPQPAAPAPIAERPPAEYAAQSTQPGLVPTAPEAGSDGPLQADPNDYSVAPDGTIEVQAAETLGHYAEWLGIRASRLRSLNGMRYQSPLVVGKRLRLDFNHTTRVAFEAHRREHHQALQQAFFAESEIVGSETYVVRRGDSIWTLANRKYDVPLWLVRQYNPDVDFAALHAGERLAIPTLRAR